MPNKTLLRYRPSHGVGDQDNGVGCVDRESTPIQQRVMQRAQGDTVLGDCGAAMVVPSDVGGFDRHRRMAEHHPEAADGALVAVRLEYELAEAGVPRPSRSHPLFHVEADSCEEVVVVGNREVVREDLESDLPGELGAFVEGVLEVGAECPRGVLLAKLALLGVRVAEARDQRLVRSNCPQAVCLKTPERVLGMERLPWRAELQKEVREVLFCVPERDRMLAANPPTAA
jgi:hypothetical protein